MTKSKGSAANSMISGHLLAIYREARKAGTPELVNVELRERVAQQIPTLLSGVIAADANRELYPKRFAVPTKRSSIYRNILGWSDVALTADKIEEAVYPVPVDDGSHTFVQPYIGTPILGYTGRLTSESDLAIVGDELRLRLQRSPGDKEAAVVRVIAPVDSKDSTPIIHAQIHFK